MGVMLLIGHHCCIGCAAAEGIGASAAAALTNVSAAAGLVHSAAKNAQLDERAVKAAPDRSQRPVDWDELSVPPGPCTSAHISALPLLVTSATSFIVMHVHHNDGDGTSVRHGK